MYVIVHRMLRTDPLRSPVRHSPCAVRVPGVLAYPMRRISLPSNAVSVFYIRNSHSGPSGKISAHHSYLSGSLFL